MRVAFFVSVICRTSPSRYIAPDEALVRKDRFWLQKGLAMEGCPTEQLRTTVRLWCLDFFRLTRFGPSSRPPPNGPQVDGHRNDEEDDRDCRRDLVVVLQSFVIAPVPSEVNEQPDADQQHSKRDRGRADVFSPEHRGHLPAAGKVDRGRSLEKAASQSIKANHRRCTDSHDPPCDGTAIGTVRQSVGQIDDPVVLIHGRWSGSEECS
ncbi:hypothetical protein RB5649 [Rhodopirellula baltica SH 1]|uniref:Uncharacterized protein n=1 Tax=Rhodopirellula baltica (strain DSM 10527 / NCIMB 13988 / SH1) TaxID=243090 RepID=Q7URH9_RHOBA|nr:hypothetical protein RB5649 [Rhodopirellula baltica SH 1]